MEATKPTYQYIFEPKTKKWIVYAPIDTEDTDFETGEILYGMSAIEIAECETENKAIEIASNTLQHYYEWGNEPAGFVSVGFYNADEVWVSAGFMLRKNAKKLGLTFNNPNH